MIENVDDEAEIVEEEEEREARLANLPAPEADPPPAPEADPPPPPIESKRLKDVTKRIRRFEADRRANPEPEPEPEPEPIRIEGKPKQKHPLSWISGLGF